MRRVLRVGLTELPRAVYHSLHDALRPFLDTLEGDAWEDAEGRKRASDMMERTYNDYGETFDHKSAREILDEHVPLPVRREVTLDERFIEQMPAKLKEEQRFDPSLSRSGASIKIIEPGAQGLHFAREGQAIRALKLERRPTILVTGGAKYLATEGEEGMQAEAMADAVLKVAIEKCANVVIPGTQSGLGILLAKKFREHYDALSEDEREGAPRFLAIEPGKELYYPGNELLDVSEDTSIYPVTAVDTIVTPYHAGWAKHGSKGEYRDHIHYRQAVITRLAGGQPSVVVTGSGGKWTVMENTVALEDGMGVIAVGETGRFASLIEAILAEGGELPLSDTAIIEHVCAIAEKHLRKDELPRIKLEFEDEAYREELVRFLRRAQKGGVEAATVASLEERLRKDLEVENVGTSDET